MSRVLCFRCPVGILIQEDSALSLILLKDDLTDSCIFHLRMAFIPHWIWTGSYLGNFQSRCGD